MHRDVFLKSLRREIGGHVPKRLSLCPPQLDRFEQEYGHRDYAKEWDFSIGSVSLPFPATCEDFSSWHGELSERTTVDSWGIGWEAAADGSHFSRIIHPLANARSVEEIRSYPFPATATAEDVNRAREEVDRIRAEGFVAMTSVCPVGGTIFWPPYKLRGMENLLCDLYTAPEIAEFLFDAVTDLCTTQVRLAAETGVDIIHLADDLGTQQSTYMSPEAFRRWIKPRLGAVIAAAKEANPDVLIHFHSDGYIEPFIPDLIEIGVDILNPVQPECMDPLEVFRKYGDRLSLSGCVGTQTTMPFGTPEEVEARVRLYCETIGSEGGLWIAPTHLVEPEVPWENIMAFIHTAEEYA